jgi:hypothetical protein
VAVKVVDLNGRIVYSEDKVTFSNEKSFDLSKLSAGIYMIDMQEKVEICRQNNYKLK